MNSSDSVNVITPPAEDAALQCWLDYLLAIHPQEIEMGLDRVATVAGRMQLLDLAPAKVITVGGTNGKGTTCRMLELILQNAGYRVGVYSSPHLLRYNERVRIQGKDACDEAFIAAFSEIEKARGEVSLSFFEYGTLAAFKLFKQAALDVVILEVGLGGRLDATNIIDADVSVITAVDLDHQAFLGSTREQIGYEKAGIFRHQRPAIVGEPDMPITVADVAAAKGAILKRVGQQFDWQQTSSQHWCFKGEHWHLTDLPVPQLPLPNAATALAALESLFGQIPLKAIVQGLQQATLTGRMEHFREHPLILLDVAHNPHAARYLASQLNQLPRQGKLYGLCGMLKDKDIHGVLSVLSPVVDEWFLVSLHNARGATATTLHEALPATTLSHQYKDMMSAWHDLSSRLQHSDVVIVFGSFYTVSGFKEVVQAIGKE
ncbi:bifunctional tetrahydrofolate synthase/dihydrofolate synthase [Shewanella yunxiaonensis]|uniref:Dihydrofolate synthase/folylpolyglutamate synthase n=1 Tax=Shewanella yunxiaonensis TaxID=2829809 RepID=A0ABX7YWL3_9GAMM|nr:bifunctional tetrahydrofolate synthase/dihydrofolate synthase [Shewanella yunxiaonensis]QUN07203.1 bifunctional tetrahydrofolate synthase/dihydrofolate synthase [Shewanella yunxiaonensis]